MSANGIYRANRKSTNQKTGKTYWNPVGLTVWVGEYKGEPSISVVDERTGERYPCFPPRERSENTSVPTDGPGTNYPENPDPDDVPF